MVQVNERNEIIFTTVEQTWLEFLKDVFRRNWKKFGGWLLHIVENTTRLIAWTVPGVQDARSVIQELALNNLPSIQYRDHIFFQITA